MCIMEYIVIFIMLQRVQSADCALAHLTCSANRLKEFTEAFARGQEILKNGGTALDAVQEVLCVCVCVCVCE